MASPGEILGTKGLLGVNNNSIVSISSKGHIYTVVVEEVPTTTPSSGGGGGRVGGYSYPTVLPLDQKLVKVTVAVEGETFTEFHEVDKTVTIKAKDIDVEFNGKRPTIKIKNIGVLDKV